MLKISSEFLRNERKCALDIETKNSGAIEFLGAINLLMEIIFEEDEKIKNEKQLLKALKEYRKTFGGMEVTDNE